MNRTVLCLFGLLISSFLVAAEPIQANAADSWWNEAWPYRVPVTVSGSGVAQISIDFTATFNTLGLNGALLDVRSLRVVATTGSLAFVSHMGVDDESAVRVLEVRGLDIRRQLAVISRRGVALSPAAAAFAERLREGVERATFAENSHKGKSPS